MLLYCVILLKPYWFGGKKLFSIFFSFHLSEIVQLLLESFMKLVLFFPINCGKNKKYLIVFTKKFCFFSGVTFSDCISYCVLDFVYVATAFSANSSIKLSPASQMGSCCLLWNPNKKSVQFSWQLKPCHWELTASSGIIPRLSFRKKRQLVKTCSFLFFVLKISSILFIW